MFVCRVFLTPGGPSETDKEILAISLLRLSNAFPELHPRIEAINHFVEFRDVQPENCHSINTYLQHDGAHDFDVAIEEQATDTEIGSSAFVPLLVNGDHLDSDQNGDPLNTYPVVKCAKCLIPDEQTVPEPYVISERNVRRIQDLYYAEDGIFIVSSKALEILKAEAPGLFQHGYVTIQKGVKPKLVGTYFWIRPAIEVGIETHRQIIETCRECGNAIIVRKREIGDPFLDAQLLFEAFPSAPPALALSGTWYGQRSKKRPYSVVRTVLCSGHLYSKLKTHKLKGLVRPSQIARVAPRNI